LPEPIQKIIGFNDQQDQLIEEVKAEIKGTKFILRLPNGNTLYVKELFDKSVNLYRCLVQKR